LLFPSDIEHLYGSLAVPRQESGEAGQAAGGGDEGAAQQGLRVH